MYRKMVTVPVREGGCACFWLDELRGFIDVDDVMLGRYVHITCVDQTGNRWYIYCTLGLDGVKQAIAEAEMILIRNDVNGIGMGAQVLR